MGFIGFLIIFILVVFYILPAIAKRLVPYIVKRRLKKFFNQQNQNFQKQREEGQSNREGSPTKKRKKIAEDVGEYVKFEELNVTVEKEQTTATDGSTSTTKYTIEEQIVDVEWEDIK